MSDINTKEKILDAAENLFVDNGFSATSLRAIIKKAGVNTASVHYHFGSKEGLIEAVIHRRVADLNRERLEMLDVLEAHHGDWPVPLEDVIRAFLLPVMQRYCAGGHEGAIPKLMGRAVTEPDDFHGKIGDAFTEIADRFGKAIARAMPELSGEEAEWRLHMMVGVLVFTVIGARLHCGKIHQFCPSRDHHEATERLVQFLAAGMRAPMPAASGKEAT
jgi:AcrR family transcriptional regulator